MSFSVAMVGLKGSGKTSLMQHIKHGHVPEGGEEATEFRVQYNGSQFHFTQISELTQLSADYAAVVFCLDGANLAELPQAKELFDRLLDHVAESVVLGVVQTKADLQTIDVKELEQFLQKIGVVIGSVSTTSGDGIDSLMQWLQSELTQTFTRKVTHDFEAEPRVVKSRGKYKINEQQTVSKSQQTFNNLMKEKRIKLLDPTQQEQEYVKLEKDRIKVENMYSQLNNFKKNKKKMTPYEIKPSANPRIQVNLEFFLTDSASTIEKIASTIDTQTDNFVNPPPSPAYVPKKTGIDAATQVEDYELFNFDREVTPILDVMVTKSLEQACLEIEQEEEIQSMKRFKEAFLRRRTQDKDKQKAVIQKEVDLITQKNEVLKKYIEREERKNYLLRKAQAYQIAGTYFRDLQPKVLLQVFKQGFYPDQFQNAINTTYLDWLVERTQQEAIKIQEVKQRMIGTFDADQLHPILEARLPRDLIITKKRVRAQRKQVNNNMLQRVLRIVYQDDKQVPTTIAQKLPKLLDGTLDEWERNYDARMQEIDAKLDSEQMTEEEYILIKTTEFPDLPLNYLGMSVSNLPKLGFVMAHNQFYVTSERERVLQPFALVVDRAGKWFIIDQANQRDGKIIRYKDNFRGRSQKASDDTAIIVQLQALHPDICCVLFGLRLPNLQANSQPQAVVDAMQHARFSVYDTSNRIDYNQTSVVQSFKFDELVKVQEQAELADAPQTSLMFCYALTRRFKQFGKWFVESTKVASKGLLQDELPLYYQKVSTFVAEQYEQTLMMERELVMAFAQRESDTAAFTLQEQNQMLIKRRIPKSKSNSFVEKETTLKHIDEPKETPKSLCCSRVSKELVVSLEQDFEVTEEQLIKHLQAHDAALIESCVHGFEIHVRGRPFTLQKQLIRSRTIGDVVLLRKPEPIPERVETIEESNDNQEPVNDD